MDRPTTPEYTGDYYGATAELARIRRYIREPTPPESSSEEEEEEEEDKDESDENDESVSEPALIDDFQPWIRSHCARINEICEDARKKRLEQYDRITDLIEDPNHEVWDINGKLTPEFLARFSDTDSTILLDAFRNWEAAPNVKFPPGEGPNIWPWWADRHPEHTEVEWNIYWDYHVRQTLLLGQFIPAFKNHTLLDKLGRAPKNVVAKRRITALDPVTRPREQETKLNRRNDYQTSSSVVSLSRGNNKRRKVPLTPLTVRAHKYGKSVCSHENPHLSVKADYS